MLYIFMLTLQVYFVAKISADAFKCRHALIVWETQCPDNVTPEWFEQKRYQLRFAWTVSSIWHAICIVALSGLMVATVNNYQEVSESLNNLQRMM